MTIATNKTTCDLFHLFEQDVDNAETGGIQQTTTYLFIYLLKHIYTG